MKYDDECKRNAVELYKRSDKSLKDLGEELGIVLSTYHKWVKAERVDGAEAFPGKGRLKAADAELARLRTAVRIAHEARYLKKSLGHLLITMQQKYKFMKTYHAEFSLERMSHVLGVARSGYYWFIQDSVSKRQEANHRLTDKIRQLFTTYKGRYGILDYKLSSKHKENIALVSG